MLESRPFFCRWLWLSFVLICNSLQASTLISQSFATNPTWGGTGWFRGGTTNPAVNTGWLRLTSTTADSFGYVFYNTAFSVNQGFVIDFEFASWGGSGADGLTLFLFDGAVTSGNFRIGDEGGSLGYANGCNGDDGMESAYLGVAFDEFGNFANPADRCKSGGPGAVADAVTLRGAGDYTTGAVGTNYAYLTHGVAPTSIDCPSCATRPAVTSADWRRARITMLKSGSTWSVYVDVQFGAGQPFTRIVNPTTLPSPPYTTLKLGFAASTGGSTNYHEIRNVLVTNPVDTTISKTVSAADAMVGQAFSYALTVSNTNITAAANVTVTDTLQTTQTSYSSYSISPAGGSCSFASPTVTCTLGSMAVSTSKTITLNVQGISQGSVTNTASVNQDDIDINPNNNNATATNTVWSPPTLTVVKSASNTAGSNISASAPGSDIVYAIQTSNSGGPSKSNIMTDAMSPFTALYLDYGGSNTPFVFSALSSGLTLGSVEYSYDDGSTWTTTVPASGGGGAPARYNGAVTNFRITLTGTMGTLTSGTTSHLLRYQTRVE